MPSSQNTAAYGIEARKRSEKHERGKVNGHVKEFYTVIFSLSRNNLNQTNAERLLELSGMWPQGEKHTVPHSGSTYTYPISYVTPLHYFACDGIYRQT